MNEIEVLQKLEEKFPAPQYAFLRHVRNSTGYSAKTVRTADALAFGLWPSRGLDLHGFEVKVAKSDLQRELDNPEKADEIAQYCDYWWIAVPSPNIYEGLVLPSAWGIIVCSEKKKARVAKEADKLKAKPLNRAMLAAIMRKVHESAGLDAEIARRVREQTDKVWKEAYESGKKERARVHEQYNKLLERVQKFKEGTGIDLEWSWDIDADITLARRAFQLIVNLEKNGGGVFSALSYISAKARELSERSDNMVSELEKVLRNKRKQPKEMPGQERMFEEDV